MLFADARSASHLFYLSLHSLSFTPLSLFFQQSALVPLFATPRLRTLNLVRCREVTSIAALSVCTSLTELYYDNKLDDQSAAVFPTLPSLEKVRLYAKSDTQYACIFSIPRLRDFNYSEHAHFFLAGPATMQVLPSLANTIEYLGVPTCPDFAQMVPVLGQLTKLRRLSLWGRPKLSQEHVDELRRMLPRLEILCC